MSFTCQLVQKFTNFKPGAIASFSLFFLLTVLNAKAHDTDFAEPLKVLAGAGYGSEKQIAQQRAWREVAGAQVESLTTILSSLEGATPLGRNWLRTAADTIAERHYQEHGDLPKDLLESFVTDQSQPPLGRRVAFEWLERVDPTAQARLLPKMLDDSSLDLRFAAVARLMEKAEQEPDPQQQLVLYQNAFTAARDVKQIETLAKKIAELGGSADLIKQMGYVIDWQIVGPFDNTNLEGFATEYGPETDFEAGETSYEAKAGKVRWQPHQSENEFGVIDLNEILENEKEVIAYARAEIVSDEKAVELRMASKNALKVWLNGEQVGEFEIYHSGFAVDQYVVPVQLNRGKNTLLVKVCQNAKKMGWEKEWEFRLRITDELGGAAVVKTKQFVESE